MNIIKLKTNINCGGCKAKVSNFLNNESAIKHWDVDIENPDKILTVEGDDVNEQMVISAIGKAGYKGSVI
jgi:copper chaperone